MLLNFDRYISYTCPVCGQTTQCRIIPFHLSGKSAIFSCCIARCKSEIFTIIEKKDKYIIEYLCAACGGVHRFTISISGFWSKDIIVPSCPETGLEMISFGTEHNVGKNLKEHLDLYKKAEEELYSDPALSLYFDMVNAINVIAKSNSVICKGCTKNAADIELVNDAVVITCRNCGAKKQIPITMDAFKELSETGTIVLE